MPKPAKEGTAQNFRSAILASRGVVLAFLSGLFISVTTLLVKHMKNIFPGQLSLYRFSGNFAFCLPHLVYNKETLLPADFSVSIIIIIAFVHATALFFNFLAFRYLPLGEAAVLTSIYPAFIVIAARIFLKEKLGVLQVTSVITTIVAMVLTTGLHKSLTENSKSYTTENIYGLAAAFISVAFATVTVLLLRKLRNIHWSVFLSSMSFAGVIESAILTALFDTFTLHYKGLQQSLMILLAFSSYVGLTFITIALKYSEAGTVSTMRASSEIFFSFLWQVTIFGQIPDVVVISGAILVCISIILLGFSRQINTFCLKNVLRSIKH